MTWFGWVLVAFYALSALLTISTIGEERKPIKPGTAAISVALSALMVVGVLAVGTGRL